VTVIINFFYSTALAQVVISIVLVSWEVKTILLYGKIFHDQISLENNVKLY